MKLEDFLIVEEGDDSRHLPDGRIAATWDPIGKVFNIGPGLTHGVTKDTVWTQEQLKAAEDAEFATARAAVANLVKIPLADLGENRTTVLESFTYNVGVHGLAISSVLRDVNARKFDAVPAALRLWNKAHGVVIRGLIKRRNDEIRLWNHPDDVPPPSDLKTSKNVPPASFSVPSQALMETHLMADSAPVVTTPASAFGVLISPLVNLATQIATGVGAAIFANGGQQIITKMLDPNTGAFAALANGNFFLGALLAGASYYVSHKLVTGSNAQTISALTPTQAPTS